ncbi:hypothetical protein [Gemmatimonas phototrophica]|uniref:Uncharacterized protein n=1 Tax=Gemmatimonas phototrophica TaxID=1379270 RepID=A0A143BLN0_9BACT|nr:hypothetical protein [Gemmatimonas phototrophica]AMW05495.1 hypothetical protein GEMMAAP_13145 [Gemmatimonas phototrophica]
MHTLLAIATLAISLSALADSLPGRYVLDRDASEDVTAVVESAIANVSRLKRNRMRSELLAQLRPSPTLMIRAEASGFVITDSEGRVLRAIPGAPTARITTPRGEAATVDAYTRNDTLVVRIQSPAARREQLFMANATELIVASTYTLNALDAPIRLRMVYRREAQ